MQERIRHVPLYDVAMTWDIHSTENAGTLTVVVAPFRVVQSHTNDIIWHHDVGTRDVRPSSSPVVLAAMHSDRPATQVIQRPSCDDLGRCSPTAQAYPRHTTRSTPCRPSLVAIRSLRPEERTLDSRSTLGGDSRCAWGELPARFAQKALDSRFARCTRLPSVASLPAELTRDIHMQHIKHLVHGLQQPLRILIHDEDLPRIRRTTGKRRPEACDAQE